MTVRVANDFKTEAQRELERLVSENKVARDRIRLLEDQMHSLKGKCEGVTRGLHVGDLASFCVKIVCNLYGVASVCRYYLLGIHMLCIFKNKYKAFLISSNFMYLFLLNFAVNFVKKMLIK